MRATPDSTGNTTPDDTQPDDNRQLRWLERLSAYRQPIGLLFTLLLFSAGLFACWHLLHELDPDALRSAFVLGNGRSFDQDPRFGLIVLCEVAQRALSPAVNDPGTAIAAMNTITRVLVDTPTDQVVQEAPLDRLTLVPLDPADFIHQAFDPIARDGAGVPEVQVRMQKLLSIIAAGCDEALGNAARRQAATSLQRALQVLVLDEDKAHLSELHTTLFSRSATAA